MEHIPYFDAHCDTIYRCLRTGAQLRENDGHLDLRRASAFERFAQVFALYQDPEEVPQGSIMVREGQLLHQKFLREMEQNRDVIVPCRTGAEVDQAAADGKMAAILSIEGAELIGCDPGQVETAAEWGVRFLNPVWNWPNVLSGTNCRDTDRGLSPLGADFLRQLEACHICPDVSHISDPGFWDVVRLARGPVVATHSNSRALCPHRRNLTDDMFRAIRDSGGVVGLNLYRSFVGPAGTMEELVAHVEHFLELGGEKTLGFGGDWDGCDALPDGIPSWDPLWPDKERWQGEEPWHRLYPDQFFIELARDVAWGVQPMVCNLSRKIQEDPEFREPYRFILETAKFYHANRKFLFDGAMLSPEGFQCGKKEVKFMKRMIFTKKKDSAVIVKTLPVILHSIWKAPDGEKALILANYTGCEQEWSYQKQSGKIPAHSYRKITLP